MLLCAVVGGVLLLQASLQGLCQNVNEERIHFIEPKNFTLNNHYTDEKSNIKWAHVNESLSYYNNITNSSFSEVLTQTIMTGLINMILGDLSVGKSGI